MSLAPGTHLGPYEILAPLGSGGMGEVYRARDPRLNRNVAIKTSAAKFSERFEREVRAIAALNHPHICQIYDVGPDYLVMELVDGAPVKGPLPLDQALKLAIQLAGAMAAAHRESITHRDLKPANILNTKSGIKVLDFGLAKIEQAKAAADDETVTRALTQEGAIVGTLQYMAPEQLNGKTVDSRADIFSFGCVLYEMLTGKRAFDGATAASVIAGILEREPPSVGHVAPAALDRLLKRCFAKDPDYRYQSAGDLRADLEWIASSGGMETPTQTRAVLTQTDQTDPCVRRSSHCQYSSVSAIASVSTASRSCQGLKSELPVLCPANIWPITYTDAASVFARKKTQRTFNSTLHQELGTSN